IILGLGSIFQKPPTQITIGLIGGLVLALMAFSMFKSSSSAASHEPRATSHEPALRSVNEGGSRAVYAGIVLTASNPYFLIWWATIGLALATRATQFGLYAFVLFTITHWLVDLIWVTALSLAAFHGISLLGPKALTITLKICAAAMLLFALFFLYSSISLLIRI
ncbi:MAG: LysE family transporter, partial [Sedimentisphaerales bacterium]|nr:LysE family transporter [Sedimentisphaerales bacterium]